MFEFECWHENNSGDWCRKTYIAKSSSKAKYLHYKYLQDGIWEDDFFEVVKNMHCKKIGKASVVSFFGDLEKFNKMKEYRSIPNVFMGMKIQMSGKSGLIVGANSGLNLDVVFDGNWFISNCHPHWETVYFSNNGEIVYDFRENRKKSLSSSISEIERYIASMGYTYSVDDVLNGYKHKNQGFYVSNSINDVIEKHEVEIKIVLEYGEKS